jgi:hypothetical protein
MGKAPTKQQLEEAEYRHRMYLDERKSLIEAEQRGAEQFDKGILTLSSGALAISLVFLEKFAVTRTPESLWWLCLSWPCLVASMLSTLSSFLTSQHAYRKQRAILDDLLEDPNGEVPRNLWAGITSLLNWLSIILFIVGVAALTRFSIINL